MFFIVFKCWKIIDVCLLWLEFIPMQSNPVNNGTEEAIESVHINEVSLSWELKLEKM